MEEEHVWKIGTLVRVQHRLRPVSNSLVVIARGSNYYQHSSIVLSASGRWRCGDCCVVSHEEGVVVATAGCMKFRLRTFPGWSAGTGIRLRLVAAHATALSPPLRPLPVGAEPLFR
jgi:hypothetical protein